MTKQTFPRQQRLSDNKRIKDVFTSRIRFSVNGMRLLARQNGMSYNRVLFAPARGYGNAVERNRAKRIVREIYRHIRNKVSPGWDLAFILYASEDSYTIREKQILRLCRKLGILRPTGE